MKSSEKSYDYVVVGAGTAGSVLAARLSENVDARVLLVEAGGRDPQGLTSVPAAWPDLLGTAASWGESTTVQRATGAPVAFPRGRGLGGSSAINAMIFLRGHRSSYDAWGAAGARGWGFDDLLPFLRRSERTEGRDPAVRGVAGPVRVGPASPGHPVAEAVLAGAVEVGHPAATDIASGLEEGFGWADLNIADGARVSALDAYLAPALGRPNLDVVTDAVVHRVTVAGGRATGIEYRIGAATFQVRCVGEVLLAAGAIGSAQLLLQSGIGPRAHLREVGVESVVNLPGVGSNLHDHPMCTVVYDGAWPVPTPVNNHGEVVGVVRSDAAVQAADLQILAVDFPYRAASLAGPERGYAIAFSHMAPLSRGSVRLTAAGLAIDPGYYGDPRDLEVMAAGLRIAREIGQASALASWRRAEALPGPDVHDHDSVRAFLRANLLPYFHPVGTCRIGDDDGAVIDSDLRVHGIDGLRVADASVMPSIVAANTNATVYGIAERAADLVAVAA